MESKNMKKIITVLLGLIISVSCHNKNRGLVITTDELKKIDTLEFHKLEDFDSLNVLKDSLYTRQIDSSKTNE